MTLAAVAAKNRQYVLGEGHRAPALGRQRELVGWPPGRLDEAIGWSQLRILVTSDAASELSLLDPYPVTALKGQTIGVENL